MLSIFILIVAQTFLLVEDYYLLHVQLLPDSLAPAEIKDQVLFSLTHCCRAFLDHPAPLLVSIVSPYL